MNSRNVIIGISVVVCGMSVAGVFLQACQLDGLRDEEQRLRLELKDFEHEKTTVRASQPPIAARMITSPSLELLRLRNQVSMLMRRQRELATARAENGRLYGQLACRGTNATSEVALPAGYIPKSKARNLGYTTPEATIETMLWAIQNRDLSTLLQTFDPQQAKEFEERMQTRASADEFFKTSAFPGMLIVGKEERTVTNDEVVLLVQIVPGQEPERLRFKQFGSQWKFAGGL